MRLIHLYLIFILALISHNSYSQSQIHLATHNLCPYGCYENDKEQTLDNFKGHAIKVVRCVLKKMNTELKLSVLPWERAQRRVIKNEADGFFAASKNETRDGYASITETIAEQNWQWYILKDSNINPNQEDFKNLYTFGSFIGANMLKWLIDNNYNVTAKPTNTKNLLKMLLQKRVQVILANNLVMDELILEQNLKSKLQTYIAKNKPLGVYISKNYLKKYPNFLTKFNSHIKDCRN